VAGACRNRNNEQAQQQRASAKHQRRADMNRNRVVQGLGMLLLPAALMSPGMAQEAAQSYPSRPVTLVIPYPAGGPNDLEGRLYMGKLTMALGKPFVLDFKPGAGGAIGHDHVAKSKADGYTLLLAAGSFTILPSLTRKLPYDTVKDFAPVSLMSRRASVLVAHMNFPAKTFQEYLAYAKANPGKINFGTTGVGSTAHMGGAWMHSAANTKVTYVHYKGLGPMLLELVSGPLDVGPSGLLSAMQLKTAARNCCPICPRRPSRASRASTMCCGWVFWRQPKHRPASLTSWPTN
jgi:tripartite-type tricarboxylate transporter receptor subunit TctC